MRRKKLITFILLAVIVIPAAPFAYANERDREVKVATYNMYPGTEFSGIFEARSDFEALLEVSEAFQDVVASNVPERIDEIADQIVANEPDVVGLQEVALWRIGQYNPEAPAETVVFDFLQMLLDELSERGVQYSAISVQVNLEAELPGLFGPNFPADLRDVGYTDRVVILARTDLRTSEMKIEATANGTFANLLPVSAFGQTIMVKRGWTYADIKHRGKTYRFVNAHLESFYEPIQWAQAAELVAGPASTEMPLIVAGDFNSDAATGGYTYQTILLGAGGLSDAWTTTNAGSPGLTWALSAENPSALLEPTERIDFVLFRGLTATSSDVLGEETADLTPSGFRASDHAGVAAEFVLHP
jgi:endonuclease/exonuclease/phosphatase family metal-dependent hydrolase